MRITFDRVGLGNRLFFDMVIGELFCRKHELGEVVFHDDSDEVDLRQRRACVEAVLQCQENILSTETEEYL